MPVEEEWYGQRRLVVCREALARTMKLMHAHTDGFLFDNCAGEFQVMFRTSVEDAEDPQEECCFEVAVYTDDDPKLEKVLKTELSGYFDDDSTYVVDSVFVKKMSKLAADTPAVGKLMTLVNEVWNWRLCVCGKMFCKYSERCLLCLMSDSTEDMDTSAEPCLICHDACANRYSATMDCCGARMHARCLGRWQELNDTCPHCRAVRPS